MTDTIKPQGMSFFEMISESTMEKVGGRIYADITHDLSSFIGRKRLVMATGKQDPLMQSAIKQLINDKDFMSSLPRGKRNIKGGIFTISSILETIKIYRRNDPTVIDEILDEFEKETLEIDGELSKLSGEQALDFILKDRDSLLTMAYNPTMLGAITAAILANDSLNKNIEKWLGDKNVADIFTKSLDHNITTEMGMALGDLSDTIRKHSEVSKYISDNPSDESFFKEMEKLPGGQETSLVFKEFIDKFGMRCPGEIDITKDRFEERPTVNSNIVTICVLAPGEHKIRFIEGRQKPKTRKQK